MIELFLLDLTASISLLTAFIISIAERKKVDRIKEVLDRLESMVEEDGHE